MTDSWLRGVHVAPNIQGDADVYELENAALDRDGRLLDAMRELAPWEDKLVVDLGAGTSYWVPHVAQDATHVFSIEPHAGSRSRGMKRLVERGVLNASVMAGSAAQTMMATHSVDIVHARFAYFWGRGCEAGLAELERIIRPGGAALIVDNDLGRGEFARWLTLAGPAYRRDADELADFWAGRGFESALVEGGWSFERREDLEAVVRLEFPDAADAILSSHTGTFVDYAFRVYWRRYPVDASS